MKPRRPDTPPEESRPLPLHAHLGRLEAVMASQRTRDTLDELFSQLRPWRRGWGSVLPTL